MIKSFTFFNYIKDNKINCIFRGNDTYKLIHSENYRFFDARLYCTATFIFDSYIKAYTGKCQKYVFLYEKITSTEILKMILDELTHDDFNSLLRNNNILT